MHRLFLALRLPAPLLAACDRLMDDGPPGWAWQDDEQLHITLRFIGEVDRRAAEDIADALAQLRSRPVEAGIDGVGWFDHGPRGALFARVTPRPPLESLHAKLDRLLVRLGHEPERRAFLPHVTLARRRRAAESPDHWLAANAGFSAPPVTIDAVTLFESRLGRAGAAYEAVASIPLGG